MSKAMITRLFWGSLIGFFAALILLAVSVILAYGSGSFVMEGSDVVGLNASAFGWSMIAIAVFALLAVSAAALVQFVAWIGAVLNTVHLEEKAWFVVLLVTGLLGVGFVAMVAYAIAGPDGTAGEAAEVKNPKTPPNVGLAA